MKHPGSSPSRCAPRDIADSDTAITAGACQADVPSTSCGQRHGQTGRKRGRESAESDIQEAVLHYLQLDRRVAWARRFNTGAHVIDDAAARKARLLDRFAPRLNALRRDRGPALSGLLASLLGEYYRLTRGKQRFVQYAFKGCADILGQLADGRFLAVECKTRKGRATPEQAAFLCRVVSNGGVAVLARSVDDVQRALDRAHGQESAA